MCGELDKSSHRVLWFRVWRHKFQPKDKLRREHAKSPSHDLQQGISTCAVSALELWFMGAFAVLSTAQLNIPSIV